MLKVPCTNFTRQAVRDAVIPRRICPPLLLLMIASHEASPAKPMPVIHDATSIPATPDGDTQPPPPVNASPSPPRPNRSQSTTGSVHHPLRLPPTVPEDGTLSSVQESSATPRRARASTGVTKPRGSAERLTDEDASWWTEEIHKRRDMRRRWKEVEDENTVVIGNKVDTNHPNYVTAYNMLTGLRVAVKSSSETMADYRYHESVQK
jgi:hypothetical protein